VNIRTINVLKPLGGCLRLIHLARLGGIVFLGDDHAFLFMRRPFVDEW